MKASKPLARFVRDIDRNKDGTIDRDEWRRGGGDDKSFDVADINGDGIVDANEMRQYVTADEEVSAIQAAEDAAVAQLTGKIREKNLTVMTRFPGLRPLTQQHQVHVHQTTPKSTGETVMGGCRIQARRSFYSFYTDFGNFHSFCINFSLIFQARRGSTPLHVGHPVFGEAVISRPNTTQRPWREAPTPGGRAATPGMHGICPCVVLLSMTMWICVENCGGTNITWNAMM